MPRRDGFTLVEMLIVLTIISLLVALLVPTLKSAMEASAVLECKDNHIKLSWAVQTYAFENNGSLPWNNWLLKDQEWYDNNNNAPGWLYEYPIGATPVQEDVKLGSLWTYIGSLTHYRCPRHKPPYDKGPAEALTSYVMNGAVSRYQHVDQTVPYKIHQMPSKGICFWEVDETATASGYWNDGSSLPSEGITQRHGDGATVSLFSGRSEWISRTAYNAEVVNQPGRLWCAPTPDGTGN